MSASIQPPGHGPHSDHEPQFGQQPDEANEPGQRAGDILPRSVRGAFAVGLVPGHDVPRHEPITRQARLFAHAEEVRRRVIFVVGGDESGAARCCRSTAGVFEQEQRASVDAASVWVEPGGEVRLASGVYLLGQPVERSHMAIVDSPSLVATTSGKRCAFWPE